MERPGDVLRLAGYDLEMAVVWEIEVGDCALGCFPSPPDILLSCLSLRAHASLAHSRRVHVPPRLAIFGLLCCSISSSSFGSGGEDLEAEVEGGEEEGKIGLTGKFLEQMTEVNIVQPTHCGEKIVDEVFDQNIMAEADEEVVNSGGEGKKDGDMVDFENRINGSYYNGGVNAAALDSCGRGASKGQRVAQLAQDWSDEDFEISGVERLGGMGDTSQEVIISRKGLEVEEAAPTVDMAPLFSSSEATTGSLSVESGIRGATSTLSTQQMTLLR